MPEPTLEALLEGLRRNDPAAAELLFSRYAPRVLALVERRMDRRLRGKAGADDVTQSALKSVYLRLRDGRLHAEDWDGLWRTIFHITMCKLCRLGRRHLGLKGDVPLEGAMADGVEGREADPAGEFAEAALEETLAEAVGKLTRRHREVIQFSLEGMRQKDIAEKLGRSQASVSRAVTAATEELRRMLGVEQQGLESGT